MIPSTAANNEWLRRILYSLNHSGVDGMAELQDDNTLLRQILASINYAGTQQSSIGNVIVDGSYALTSPTATQFYAANPPTDVAATWGSITGDIDNQADLQTALNAKASTSSVALKQDIAWTIVTATGTDVNGAKVAANTAGSAYTRNLPASPSVGDSVVYLDSALNWNTNNLTIGRNGQLLNSGTSNFTANVQAGCVICTFVGGSIGWSVTIH